MHVALNKLEEAYGKLGRFFQDSYIKGLISLESSTENTSISIELYRFHKPPYEYDIFVPWVQNAIVRILCGIG